MSISKIVFKLCFTALFLLIYKSAAALPIELEDQNSRITIAQTFNGLGVSSWEIDTVDELFFESFWIGVGDNAEANITTLNLTAEDTFDTNNSGTDNLATLSFTDPGGDFDLDILFNLFGENRGPGTSEIREEILITNTSGASEVFHFFAFTDYDLGGSAFGDFAQVIDNSPFNIRQKDPDSERVVETPSFNVDRFEISDPANIFAKLEDSFPTNLAFDASTIVPPSLAIALPDVGFAYQYDITLSAGESEKIIIQKIATVSEPSTSILFGVGLAAISFLTRRRRAAIHTK